MSQPILSSETLHVSTVAIGGRAVLIGGRSGQGKSDLALRLIDRGAALVSDDYTHVRRAGEKLACGGQIFHGEAQFLELLIHSALPQKRQTANTARVLGDKRPTEGCLVNPVIDHHTFTTAFELSRRQGIELHKVIVKPRPAAQSQFLRHLQ